MRLPIDTGTVKFVAAAPAEPVLDYETRAKSLRSKRKTIRVDVDHEWTSETSCGQQ